MALSITVQGGTQAGQRFHKKKAGTVAWTCPNGHLNPRYAARCLSGYCSEKRP